MLFGAHHEVEPARPELYILANENTFLAIRKPKHCAPKGYRPRTQIRNVFAPHGSIKTIMSGTIKGTLTQSEFYRRNRDSKNVLVYRRNIEEYLTERGKEHHVCRFRRAFKQRHAARKA